MTPRKANPRAEYRLREIQRVNNSVSLVKKFPKLKSLTVDLAYFDTDGLTKSGEVKYKVNVHHAKSVFSFVCPSGECVGGARWRRAKFGAQVSAPQPKRTKCLATSCCATS